MPSYIANNVLKLVYRAQLRGVRMNLELVRHTQLKSCFDIYSVAIFPSINWEISWLSASFLWKDCRIWKLELRDNNSSNYWSNMLESRWDFHMMVRLWEKYKCWPFVIIYCSLSVTNYHLYLHEKATNRVQAQCIFLAISSFSLV